MAHIFQFSIKCIYHEKTVKKKAQTLTSKDEDLAKAATCSYKCDQNNKHFRLFKDAMDS